MEGREVTPVTPAVYAVKGIRAWLERRRRKRRRTGLLSRLVRAERLRASRYFSELDYALVAVGVLAELDEQAPGVGRGRFEGRLWHVPEWRQRCAFAVEASGDTRALGPYLDAPIVVARNERGVAGRTPNGSGGWVADLNTFQWTPGLTERVDDASLRVSPVDRGLRWTQEKAERYRKNYPLVVSATVVILGLLATIRGC